MCPSTPYASLLADENMGDDEEVSGGFGTLRQVGEADPTYSFAIYALRANGSSLNIADACKTACSEQVSVVLAYTSEHGDDTICDAPGKSQLLHCIAGLSNMMSPFCEATPLVDKVGDCVNVVQQADATRRLGDGKEVAGQKMPDGSHKVDLAALSWQVRADMSRELGMDLLSQKAVLYANSSEDPTGALVETTDRSGLQMGRRLGYMKCYKDDGFKYPVPGELCFRWMFPWNCDGSACDFSLSLLFKIYYDVWPPSASMTLRVDGGVDLIQMFFGGAKMPIYGKLGGWGLIQVGFPSRCPHIIPFNMEGQVGAYVSVGVQVPGLGGWDLAKLSLWIGIRNIWVKAHRSWHRGDRRRRWGSWSRRRRAWYTRWHRDKCDIEVYAGAEVQIFIVTGTITARFAVFTKRLTIDFAVHVYLGIPFWLGSWLQLGRWKILERTFR